MATMDEFKTKAREFALAFKNLEARKAEAFRDPKTRAEYNELMSDGSTIKTAIEMVTSGVDSAWGWAQSTFGFNGAAGMAEQGMGIVPAIPLIVAGGATAVVGLLGSWIHDAYILNAKLDEMARLRGEGVSARAAAQIVNDTAKSASFFEGLKTPVYVGAAAVSLLVFWPQIKKVLSNGR